MARRTSLRTNRDIRLSPEGRRYIRNLVRRSYVHAPYDSDSLRDCSISMNRRDTLLDVMVCQELRFGLQQRMHLNAESWMIRLFPDRALTGHRCTIIKIIPIIVIIITLFVYLLIIFSFFHRFWQCFFRRFWILTRLFQLKPTSNERSIRANR